MHRAQLAWIAIAVITLVACGNQPSESTTVTRSFPEPTSPSTKSTLELRGDLESPYEVSWKGYEIVNDHTVAVTVAAGLPECTAANAAVAETASAVSIGITTGGKPGAGACQAVSVTSKVIVPISSPLNNRKILDAHPRK